MFLNIFALTARDLKRAPIHVVKTNNKSNIITFSDDYGNEFDVLRYRHEDEYVYIPL